MTSSVQIFGWLEHITPPAANEAGDALLAAAPLPTPGLEPSVSVMQVQFRSFIMPAEAALDDTA